MGEKTARGRMCDNCLKGHKARCIVPWCPCICRQPIDHLDSPAVRMYFKERYRADKIVPRMIVVEDNGEPKRILYARFTALLEGKEVPLGGGSKGEGLPRVITIPTYKEKVMNNRSKRQQGFSLIELLIVVAIILVIAAIAIPSLLSAKRAANEASAAASIRTITVAESTYQQVYPSVGYASTLASLGGALGVACVPSSTTACLIDSVLASNGNPSGSGKSGYNFNTGAGTIVGGVNVGFTISAQPLSIGTTGNRAFCAEEDNVIRVDPLGACGGSTPSETAILSFNPLNQ